MDPHLTAFEPEARGNLVEGLEFQKFYFDNGKLHLFFFLLLLLLFFFFCIVCLMSESTNSLGVTCVEFDDIKRRICQLSKIR